LSENEFTPLFLLPGRSASIHSSNHPPTHTQTKHTADSAKGNKREGGEQQATGDECLEEQNAMEAHVHDD